MVNESSILEFLNRWAARFVLEEGWGHRVSGSTRIDLIGDQNFSFTFIPGSPPSVVRDSKIEPDCTLSCPIELFYKVLHGEENLQALWNEEQIELKGQVQHLLFLSELID